MFLQTNLSELKIEDLFMPVVVCMIAFIVCVLITREIFSIPTILKYYKTNTLLNIKIARALGVSEAELDDIMDILDRREGKYTNDYKIRSFDGLRNRKPVITDPNAKAENEDDVNNPDVLKEIINKANKND